MDPIVAVIVMATHNPDPVLLRRQVQSITEQTERRWIAVVVDDGSSTAALTQVNAAIADDQRFRLLVNDEAVGPYRAFEQALQTARSYDVPVLCADQDDRWVPNKIELELAALTSGVDAVFSAMRCVDDDGKSLGREFLSRAPRPHDLEPASLLLMNVVSGTSLAVTAAVVEAALPFPAPNERGWHDQWLAAVAAAGAGVTFLPECLVDYTVHDRQFVGAGLRRPSVALVRSWMGELRRLGVLRELSRRSAWVSAAAAELLQRRPECDELRLQSLAHGRFDASSRALLWNGVTARRVPLARALLLSAGWLVGGAPDGQLGRSAEESG